MKKFLIGATVVMFATLIVVTSTVTIIISTLSNNSNIGVFDSSGNIETFDITGTNSGNDYTLNFTAQTWSVEDIKLTLDKKTGNATAMVPLMTGNSAGEAAVAWAKERVKESKQGKWYYVYYGHGVGANGIRKSTACPYCNPKQASQGWQCIGFITACYFHGAGVASDIHTSTTYCHLGGLGTGGDNGKISGTLNDSSCDPEKIYKKWVKRNGNGWIMAAHTESTKSGGISSDQLQPGDVLLCYKSNGGCYHMAMYIGDDKYVDCSRGHGDKGGIRISKYGGTRKTVRIAMRYVGNSGSTSSTVATTASDDSAGDSSDDSSDTSNAITTANTSSSLGGVARSSQDVINGACAWAEAIAADNSFHYGHGDAAHHGGCYFCNSYTRYKKNAYQDWEKSYCCNCFVFSAFAHGGGEAYMRKRCGRRNGSLSVYTDNKHFKNLGKPAFSSLQKGDVLWYRGKDKCHYALYLGNGKLAEASGGDDNVKGSKDWNDSIHVRKIKSYGNFTNVSRYIGTGGGQMELPAGATVSNSIEYSKKPAGTILDTITEDTGNRVKISNGHTYDVAQSFAYVNGGYAVSLVPASASGSGEVRYYDGSGAYKKKISATLYHANGTSATKDGGIIVTGSLGSSTARKFSFNNGTLKDNGTTSLPTRTSSIAYDKDTGIYACSTGSSMVTSKDLKSIYKKLNRKVHGQYYQDIGAGGGFIFACHTASDNKKGNNYIDVYDEETGDFCGSYKVNYGELESCDIVNGELVLLVHIKGSETNYIQFTGIGGNGNSYAELTINYAKNKNKVTFRGTLAGGTIFGEFYVNDGKITGTGVYGGAAQFGGSGVGNTGNPFGTEKFYITDIACAYVPGHTNSFHDGWDLASSNAHAPIYAVTSGTVVYAGALGGYGNHVVIIQTQNSNNYVLYGHMSSMTVSKDSFVSAGQQIGNQGSEGHSSGNHLHLEFRKGSNSSSSSTANLSGIQSMLMQYAINYNSYVSKFSMIQR